MMRPHGWGRRQRGGIMGFENGSVSFSAFYVQRSLPEDSVERFAGAALPPLNLLGQEAVHGWVTGRHLLDRNITRETAYMAGRLRLTLVKAERKIPQPLLRAERTMEELAMMSADGKQELSRSERAEISRSVVERLLPTMPPTLTGIPIVYEPRENVLYAGATSDRQIDTLTAGIREVTGVMPAMITPETAALRRKHITVRDLSPASYSPQCEDERMDAEPGRDFLTWLWFAMEVRGGTLDIDGDQYAAIIEGPLTFYMEGDGAHLAVLQKGSPVVSSEAKASLLSGKKLRRARVTLARGDDVWSAIVDAETFIFRSVKLPPTEGLDRVSRFEERMLSIGRMHEAFLSFYDRFVEERTDPQRWAETVRDIRAWVVDRVAKA